MKCVAKTLEGLETILAQELEEIGVTNIRILKQAVEFETDQEGMYRCNYNLRTAINILVPIANDFVKNEKQLYAFAAKIRWDQYLDENKTFVIKTSINSKQFPEIKLAELKLKDAIVDYFRKRHGTKPSLDKDYPDLRVVLEIENNFANILLDSSGDALFRRGYRKQKGNAQLNEVLAAGLLLNSNWDRKSAITDPMCGSGTFPIEAHCILNKIPAGYSKIRFGLQDLPNFNKKLWLKVKEESNNKMVETGIKIYGFDNDEEMIYAAKKNIEKLPFNDHVIFKTKDFFKHKNFETAFVIINPPSHQQTGKIDIHDFYKKIGDHFKKTEKQINAWIFSSNVDALNSIGLKTSATITMLLNENEHLFNQYKNYQDPKKEQSKQNIINEATDQKYDKEDWEDDSEEYPIKTKIKFRYKK